MAPPAVAGVRRAPPADGPEGRRRRPELALRPDPRV